MLKGLPEVWIPQRNILKKQKVFFYMLILGVDICTGPNGEFQSLVATLFKNRVCFMCSPGERNWSEPLRDLTGMPGCRSSLMEADVRMWSADWFGVISSYHSRRYGLERACHTFESGSEGRYHLFTNTDTTWWLWPLVVIVITTGAEEGLRWRSSKRDDVCVENYVL